MNNTKKSINVIAGLLRDGLTKRISSERTTFEITNRVEFELDDVGPFDDQVEESLNGLVQEFHTCPRVRLSEDQKIDGLDYKKAARRLLKDCRTSEPVVL